MEIDDAIAELGQRAGRPDFALDEQGLGTLVIDGRLLVDFERLPDGRSLHLSSTVSFGELETVGTLQALLRANLLGVATGGACFSLSPDDELLFERRLDLSALDVLAFLAEVETYVNYLDGWEQRLAEGEAEGSSAAAFPHESELRIRI